MKNRSSLPNKLAMVQNDMSMHDAPVIQKISLEKRLSNVQVSDGSKVFGTGLLDHSRKERPMRTFKSKSFSMDRTGKKKQIFLPQVAMAIKMHTRAKDLIMR